jgi:NAD(P)H-flavin reductase
MGKYDSKLLGCEEIAQCTLAFHFEKPDGFAFTPGQSINLFLPEDFPGVSTTASAPSLSSAHRTKTG